MNGWRDDLPPIPAERILQEVKREGSRRQRAGRERRQRFVETAVGIAAAVVLIGFVAGLFITTSDGGGDDDDAAATTAAGSVAEATTGGTEASATGGTEAPATGGTEGPEGTTAETGGTTATTAPVSTGLTSESTNVAPATTAAGSATTAPVDEDVTVSPTEIWERPPAGGAACGPTTLRITFEPPDVTLTAADVVGAGRRRPIEMALAGNVATATIGPFATATLEEGARRELGLAVRFVDADGDTGLVRPAATVILRDCTP